MTDEDAAAVIQRRFRAHRAQTGLTPLEDEAFEAYLRGMSQDDAAAIIQRRFRPHEVQRGNINFSLEDAAFELRRVYKDIK